MKVVLDAMPAVLITNINAPSEAASFGENCLFSPKQAKCQPKA
jgi:hypothetical protein